MKGSYEIMLPEGIEFETISQKDEDVDEGEVRKFVKKLKRPTWYTNKGDATKDTRECILQNPQDFNSAVMTSTDPFKDQLRLEWKCAHCGWATTIGGVDIGHINNWRDELIKAGVQNTKEAKAVYNNLYNLQIECASCNRSHDWEELSASVGDEYEADGFAVFGAGKEVAMEVDKEVDKEVSWVVVKKRRTENPTKV